ncbi:MAG: hypothetical protein RR051_04055 [Clostridiales bacterium]
MLPLICLNVNVTGRLHSGRRLPALPGLAALALFIYLLLMFCRHPPARTFAHSTTDYEYDND